MNKILKLIFFTLFIKVEAGVRLYSNEIIKMLLALI